MKKLQVFILILMFLFLAFVCLANYSDQIHWNRDTEIQNQGAVANFLK